jgi:CSLREA domain-containing protein
MKYSMRITITVLLRLICILSFLCIPISSVYAATYTVTKTADTNDGICNADCSFREAVAVANSHAGNDEIDFAIPTSDSGYIPASGSTQAYWLIITTTTLTLSDDSGVFVNGYSQSGSTRNTASFGNTINTILTIQIFTNTSSTGINITGDNNHLAGLGIRTFNVGLASVDVSTSSNNWIEGNFFGSDITGTSASNGGIVRILNSSASNIIGTNGDGNGDVGERNLFAGIHTTNSVGGYVDISSGNSNIVAGNYMGTDKTGRVCTAKTLSFSPLSISTSSNRIGTNYDGVSDSEESNIIGCTTNNISSRAYVRVLTPSSNNLIQGNYIGISPQGDMLGELFGTAVGAVALSGLTGNVVKGNTISNANYGISVAASSVLYNTFSQNIIYGNKNLNISLSGTTPLPNDPGDTDTGANDLMNYPLITGISYKGNSQYKIDGTLDGRASEAPFTIEICVSNNESSGHGGCTSYVGSTTSSSSNWSTTVTIPGDDGTKGRVFTTTATNANGSTSEFGPNAGYAPASSSPSSDANQPSGFKYPISSGPNFVGTEQFIQNTGSDQKVEAFMSKNTSHDDVYVAIQEQTPDSLLSKKISFPWDQGLNIVGKIYDFTSVSAFNGYPIWEFDNPATIILSYDPTLLHGISPQQLRIAWYDPGSGRWQVLQWNTVLNEANHTLANTTKKIFVFYSRLSKHQYGSRSGCDPYANANTGYSAEAGNGTSHPQAKEVFLDYLLVNDSTKFLRGIM